MSIRMIITVVTAVSGMAAYIISLKYLMTNIHEFDMRTAKYGITWLLMCVTFFIGMFSVSMIAAEIIQAAQNGIMA